MPKGAPKPPAPRGGFARRAEFESLYDQFSREVWALAYARWMDGDLAMDIMQETFLRLWKQWESGAEEIQNTRAWLMRVAHNLAEDYAKSAFRRNGTQSPEILDGVSASQSLPLDEMERQEQFAQLRSVLAELAPADREILTLRYAFDYDNDTIAKRLNVAVSAVHMRLSRARQRLAERLTTHGDFTHGTPASGTKT